MSDVSGLDRTTTAAIDHVNQVRNKILFTLEVYPKVSPTMLQVALGTGLSPKLWHPVLDQLCDENIVEKIQVRPPRAAPSGRDQVYTVIQMKPVIEVIKTT